MTFSETVIQLIKNIPFGKVSTYGALAKQAGSPRAARQVSWLLHSSSKKHNLPWHRVINSKGEIAMKDVAAKEMQRDLLLEEGVGFLKIYRVDLNNFLWLPEKNID
jgi:methylated-DNA-protein-cysteine methyltransferase-like protein